MNDNTTTLDSVITDLFFFLLKTKNEKKKKKGCCYPPVTVRRSRRVSLRERYSRGWSGRRRTRDDAERTTAQNEQHRNTRTPRSSRPPLRAGHQTREITLAERVLLTRHYEPSLARGFQWVNRSSDFLPDLFGRRSWGDCIFKIVSFNLSIVEELGRKELGWRVGVKWKRLFNSR